MFISTLLTIAKTLKQPANGQMAKENISTIDYYSDLRKKAILSFVTTGIKAKGTMLSEISQIQKDKYHIISFVYRIKKSDSRKWGVE